MKLGKEIKYSIHTVNSGEQNKMCSPLALSSFWCTDFFHKEAFKRGYGHEGLGINKDNCLLRSYFSQEDVRSRYSIQGDTEVELVSIYETNGKYSVPLFAISDVILDEPERGRFYAYFVTIANGGVLHRQVVCMRKREIYLIDTKHSNVLVFEPNEYLDSAFCRAITNLSVMLLTQQNKYLFGTEGYDEELFTHIF